MVMHITRLQIISFTLFLSMLFLTCDVYADVCVKGDCENGTGTVLMPDGYMYEGEFKKGMKHGKGVLITPGGDKYIGNFKKDKFDGYGKFIYADEEVPDTARE